jgi:hypothetical protein
MIPVCAILAALSWQFFYQSYAVNEWSNNAGGLLRWPIKFVLLGGEVKSSDIYWGALPWVGLQLVMVALVIAFPVLVTGFLDAPSTVDPTKIEIDIAPSENVDQPPPDFGTPK